MDGTPVASSPASKPPPKKAAASPLPKTSPAPASPAPRSSPALPASVKENTAAAYPAPAAPSVPDSTTAAEPAAASTKDAPSNATKDKESKSKTSGSRPPRKKAATAKDAAKAEAAGGEDVDMISASSSEAAESESDSEEVASPSKAEEEEAQGGAKRGKAKAKSPVRKAPIFNRTGGEKALGKASGKVDGVGLGSLAAAASHLTADIDALITWKEGSPVPYSFLAETFDIISGTSKRLVIINTLVQRFRALMRAGPAELLPTAYLCANRVAPAHTGLELGVGEAILIKAIAQATGRTEERLKKDYETQGDLGLVASSARMGQKTMFAPQPLTIAGVFKTLKEIALTTGEKSQERKKGLIVKLLVAAKQNEAAYIVRSLQAKLRIGLAEQSLLVALGQAAALHNTPPRSSEGNELADRLETAAQLVKQAYCLCPSYDKLVEALLQHPLSSLPQHCSFQPGVPIKPMLAKATLGVAEVLEKFSNQEFTCEYKYDGERAQVHVMEDGSVAVFSRNSENNTSKFPDLVARMPELLAPGVKSIVFDSEAVAYDVEKKQVRPFQVLSTRGRKDVQMDKIKVHVMLFAFDCLYLNGEVLLEKPLTERREALYRSLVEKEAQLKFATTKTSTDVEELQTFLTLAVEEGTEGLIVKTMDDSYEVAKRSNHWLKLKKDYMEGVGDTFGKGKRTGVFGAYLLAVYDPDQELYQTISKLGTGFSEELLKELADSLRPHIITAPKNYYRYGETLVPDVWFDAVKVWEVKAADLSISPVHKAAQGLVETEKGISIRFPRLLRVREDKGPEDATSAAQVAEMYRRQAVVQQQNKKKAKDEDEDDEL